MKVRTWPSALTGVVGLLILAWGTLQLILPFRVAGVDGTPLQCSAPAFPDTSEFGALVCMVGRQNLAITGYALFVAGVILVAWAVVQFGKVNEKRRVLRDLDTLKIDARRNEQAWQDASLLARDDLQESLNQMRRGETTPVPTDPAERLAWARREIDKADGE